MEVDIYGDLDHLDNQFEVVQKENEELKETVQKLEETSIKFSIEVNELKRINSNLEANISSLFKTAKSELERKNKQITELRKELDNMLFKRGPHRKIPDKRDENTEEKQILNTQFEKAQYDIDQRNKIIQSLNTELDNVRKELNEKNNILKRNSSQIEEHENDLKAKKPKLDKESYIENEEDYRNYKNRHERNSHSNSRSQSPNFRNNGPSDFRSQFHLKRINYQRGQSRSREEFIPNNQRYNRQNYRSNKFKGKYTEYQEGPMEWVQNYRYCNKDEERERQNYSGVSSSKTPENSYRQGYISEPIFTVTPNLSDNNELEDGEIDKVNLISDSKFNNNNFNALGVPEINRRNLEQVRHDDQKYTKTNMSCTEPKSSSNENELFVTETFRNNTQDICASITLNSKKKMCNPIEVKEKITDKKKLKGDIKDLEIKRDKSKLEERKKEIVPCNNSKYLSKTKNEENKTSIDKTENNSKSNSDKVKEFAIDETWKVVPDKKVKNDAKKEKNKSPEIELHKNKKEKCNTIKTKPEKSTDNISDLKSTKEKAKLPAEKKSKSTKSETKAKQEKEAKIIESNVSETKSSDTKIEKSNSAPKDTIIKVVTEASTNTSGTKKEKVSESTDANIPIISELKLKETKEKQISESKNSNTSIVPGEVSVLQSNNIKTDSKISVVKTTQSVEINMPIISEPKVGEKSENKSNNSKSNQNVSTTEKVDETLHAAAILKNSNDLPADIKVSEIKESLKDNESLVSKTETTNSTITNVEKSSASTETEKIETTTQQIDRKPPMRGRRRRCVISIN